LEGDRNVLVSEHAGDLTVIYLTLNLMPDRWARFQLDHLRKAVGDAPVVSVSRLPMDLGTNLLQTEPRSYWNVYRQLLRGAKIAATPFVALAEDDTLYTHEHFHAFRPPLDAVSYDRSRWSLFTWDAVPNFTLRLRLGNCALIAPRDYLIDALEERERVWGATVPPNEIVGEVGRPDVERRLGVTPRNAVEWWGRNPIVQLSHPTGIDTGRVVTETGQLLKKRHGQLAAVEIPHWGRAEDLVKLYLEAA
jgi:hypothetical protein